MGSVGGQNISDSTTYAATTTSQRIIRETSLMYASCPVNILNHRLWGSWYLQTRIEVCVVEHCVYWVRDCSPLRCDTAHWTLLSLQDSILLENRWLLHCYGLRDVRWIKNCLLLKALTLVVERLRNWFAACDWRLLCCVNSMGIIVCIGLYLLIYDHLSSFTFTVNSKYFLLFL